MRHSQAEVAALQRRLEQQRMLSADVRGRAAQALARRDALVASYRPLLDRLHAAETDAAAARERAASGSEREAAAAAAAAAAVGRTAELEGAEAARDALQGRVEELQARVDEVWRSRGGVGECEQAGVPGVRHLTDSRACSCARSRCRSA